MIEALQGAGVPMAKLALDAASLRHQAIANNIANAHTEGYAPLGVRFDARLAAARRAQPEVVRATNEPVQVDAELVKLSQNTLHYQALLRGIAKHHAILGAAISDGRRA